MALSNKTINGKTPDEFLQDLFGIVRWLSIFAKDGEEIFGDEYLAVLAFVGLPMPSLVDALESLAMRGDEMVRKIDSSRKHTDDLIKGFGIKLEGDDNIKS